MPSTSRRRRSRLLDEAKFDYSKPVVWLSWNKDARDSAVRSSRTARQDEGHRRQHRDHQRPRRGRNQLHADGQWDLALYGGYPIVDPDTIRTFATCSAIGKAPGKDNATSRARSPLGRRQLLELLQPQVRRPDAPGSKISDQAQRAALYKQAQDIYLEDHPDL
jgi:ABC-type transport system substrate-binding protein